MKKVLFLMFLLLLMGLGAANVKAQVRIGGNTPPSAAAVLDLNASDAANIATGGLVLPRVDLKTNVMQLTTGVANQTGTMVYNVTTTLGQIGIFYWNGNSWVKASLPSTSASDSGKILMSDGSNAYWSNILLPSSPGPTFTSSQAPATVTFSLTVSNNVSIDIQPWTLQVWNINGAGAYDFCFLHVASGTLRVLTAGQHLYVSNASGVSVTGSGIIRCYRPSF